MDADDAPDSGKGQFRRRRSEPVHRRPRTLSQNQSLYGGGAGRATPPSSDGHGLQGEEEPRRSPYRRGNAGEHHAGNGDGRAHRQTKLIGREDEGGRQEPRNGRLHKGNGFTEADAHEDLYMRKGEKEKEKEKAAAAHRDMAPGRRVPALKFTLKPAAAAPEEAPRKKRRVLIDNYYDEDAPEAAPAPAGVRAVAVVDPVPEVKKVEKKEVVQHGEKGAEPASLESPVPSVRKSARVPKKRVLDGDDDGEHPHEFVGKGGRKGDNGKHVDEEDGAKDESTSDRGTETADEDDEDVVKTKKGRIQDIYDTSVKERPAATTHLTARQRAMLEKDNDNHVSGLIEFPDGLTDTQRRGRKSRISEADKQVKRAEAARKRKQQVEKNAKEIQASAIQKILGQDSTRKRKEEKLSKRRAELEEEKKAAALEPASNKIKWIFGSEGTRVAFAVDVPLPACFVSQPVSHPPPREKCAGPSCGNTYVYRDSRTKLPLCSLRCYKLIQNLSAVPAAVPPSNNFDMVKAH